MNCISFTENAYHAILAHNGNQQAVNPKDEFREGRVFTKFVVVYLRYSKDRSQIQSVHSEVHDDHETALRSQAQNLQFFFNFILQKHSA